MCVTELEPFPGGKWEPDHYYFVNNPKAKGF